MWYTHDVYMSKPFSEAEQSELWQTTQQTNLNTTRLQLKPKRQTCPSRLCQLSRIHER